MDEERLDGGLANAGQVVRVDDHVLRPSGPHTASIHALLRSIRAAGFHGASRPVGVDRDGRERLVFIEGEVPVTPYPAWSQTDTALVSIARLVRGFHDATAGFDLEGHVWNDALADPVGGAVVCHNDLELSNVVFRDGVAVGLIDFEFAAPGRPAYDLAHLARLCVPIEHHMDRDRMGWGPADHPARLRLVADAYGLDAGGRAELLRAIPDALQRVETAARRNFGLDGAPARAVVAATGGLEKYDRRRRWWRQHREAFAAALR